MTKETTRYCSYCGNKMIETSVPAETKKLYCFMGDCFKMPMGDAFDIKTGKRQYVKHFICPNYKGHWIITNPHDNYYDDKVFN